MKKYDNDKLEKEYQLAFEKKTLFEKNFENELNLIDSNYNDVINYVINGMMELISVRNIEVSILVI